MDDLNRRYPKERIGLDDNLRIFVGNNEQTSPVENNEYNPLRNDEQPNPLRNNPLKIPVRNNYNPVGSNEPVAKVPSKKRGMFSRFSSGLMKLLARGSAGGTKKMRVIKRKKMRVTRRKKGKRLTKKTDTRR